MIIILFSIHHAHFLTYFSLSTTPSEALQASTEDVLVLFERQAMPYQVCLEAKPRTLRKLTLTMSHA